MDPITAGTGIANTILPPLMTKITNQQNRKYALQDWERQNAYNHPKQQMKRLSEAGLNPNLVYGGGATTLAQPVKSPDMQVPNVDFQKIPESIGAYQGIKNQQLEADRIQKAMELQDAQKKNIEANTLSTLTGIDGKKLDILGKEIMNQFLPEYYEQRNRAMTEGTNVKVSENLMNQLMFPQKMDKLIAEIANTKARTGLIPTQKAQMLKNIEALTQKMYYFGLSEPQKIETGRILQQSALIKNLIQGKQVRGVELDNELKAIKKGFKEAGLSETASSDLVKQILSIVDFF